MLISNAYAQDIAQSAASGGSGGAAEAEAANAGSLVTSNLIMIVVLVVLFYFLLIRPQQKRFKEHSEMLDALKKGDKIVTAGGLVGKVDKIQDDEIVVDLGGGTKVTALRHTIQSTVDKNDTSKSKTSDSDKK